LTRRLVPVVLMAFIGALGAAAQQTFTPLQLMRAAEQHARSYGAKYKPVLSPADSANSGVSASDIKAVRAAGFPVVVWTVDDAARMQALFDEGVDGIISDRPDLLHGIVERNKSARGGLLGKDGLLRVERFDAQGHRGGRDLRPESTFPAFEVALDNLMTTLESDVGVTSDGVAILSHERHVNPQTCREASGVGYSESNRVFQRNVSCAEIRRRFVCDKLFRGATQTNDLSLSPVAVAFTKERRISNAFVHPTVQELFDFVRFYQTYYSEGAGRNEKDARLRSANAARVRFNLETKIDARYPDETVSPEVFVDVLAGVITRNHLEKRADIQSFDFRTLVRVQQKFPAIRTVYLVGDSHQLAVENLPPALTQRRTSK